jgi:hypothetical protein
MTLLNGSIPAVGAIPTIDGPPRRGRCWQRLGATSRVAVTRTAGREVPARSGGGIGEKEKSAGLRIRAPSRR